MTANDYLNQAVFDADFEVHQLFASYLRQIKKMLISYISSLRAQRGNPSRHNWIATLRSQ
jgi:hypothetical protein